MKAGFWRSAALLCLVQGLATAFSAELGMSVGLFVGIFLAVRWWFVDHPVHWWYDFLFGCLLFGAAVLATGTYVGTCAILPIARITTRACQSLGVARALALHLWVLGLIGIIFWLWHLWILWKLRHR